MLKNIFIFLFIGVNLLLSCVAQLMIAQSNYQNRRSEKDLPLQQDLDTFLKPIEFLTNYLADNTTNIELNFALGIFFTNVHLERALLDKGQNIPDEISSRIKTIVDTNEKSLSYFHNIAKKDIDFMLRDHVIISDLFVNSTYWMHRLKKLKYEAVPSYSQEDLQANYSEWKIYADNVDKVFEWNPNPKNSDICLVTLSINPKYKGNSTSWCPLANICYTMLTNGTNFGYALCHRMALLVMAHLGRGCFLLTDLEDEEVMQNLCGLAYAEAEYIAMNDYGIIDLILEIMCFCSTDGRVQFLRRTWLLKMFDFQNSNCCFGVPNHVMNYKYYGRRAEIGCNSHTTALASGTYAAAVRFILQEYY